MKEYKLSNSVSLLSMVLASAALSVSLSASGAEVSKQTLVSEPKSNDFEISVLSSVGGDEEKIVVSKTGSACRVSFAGQKAEEGKKLSAKDCDRVRTLAEASETSPSEGGGTHAPHYELEFKSGATKWKKVSPLAQMKSCDPKGTCRETGGDPSPEIKALVDFVSELSEK